MYSLVDPQEHVADLFLVLHENHSDDFQSFLVGELEYQDGQFIRNCRDMFDQICDVMNWREQLSFANFLADALLFIKLARTQSTLPRLALIQECRSERELLEMYRLWSQERRQATLNNTSQSERDRLRTYMLLGDSYTHSRELEHYSNQNRRFGEYDNLVRFARLIDHATFSKKGEADIDLSMFGLKPVDLSQKNWAVRDAVAEELQEYSKQFFELTMQFEENGPEKIEALRHWDGEMILNEVGQRKRYGRTCSEAEMKKTFKEIMDGCRKIDGLQMPDIFGEVQGNLLGRLETEGIILSRGKIAQRLDTMTSYDNACRKNHVLALRNNKFPSKLLRELITTSGLRQRSKDSRPNIEIPQYRSRPVPDFSQTEDQLTQFPQHAIENGPPDGLEPVQQFDLLGPLSAATEPVESAEDAVEDDDYFANLENMDLMDSYVNIDETDGKALDGESDVSDEPPDSSLTQEIIDVVDQRRKHACGQWVAWTLLPNTSTQAEIHRTSKILLQRSGKIILSAIARTLVLYLNETPEEVAQEYLDDSLTNEGVHALARDFLLIMFALQRFEGKVVVDIDDQLDCIFRQAVHRLLDSLQEEIFPTRGGKELIELLVVILVDALGKDMVKKCMAKIGEFADKSDWFLELWSSWVSTMTKKHMRVFAQPSHAVESVYGYILHDGVSLKEHATQLWHNVCRVATN